MTPAARFSRADICTLTDTTAPVVKNLVKGKVLRKRAPGTGTHLRFTLEDVLKVAVSKALTSTGIDVSGIRELFAALDAPSLPEARPWAWLRSQERVARGAKLVLITESPNLPAHTGMAVLLPADAVSDVVTRARGKVVIIDVHALIVQIETRSGASYGEPVVG